MRHDDGTIPALAFAASLVGLSMLGRRGARNDDDWELVPTGPTGMVRGDDRAIVRRQQLSDRNLAERLVSGGDVLGGMAFNEAVNSDPRRIAALIDQAIMPAFSMGMDRLPLEMSRPVVDAYVQKWGMERDANGGNLPTKTLVGYIEENQEHATRRMAAQMPPGSARYFEQALPGFQQVFDRAAEISMRASRVATEHDEQLDWISLADTLRAYPGLMMGIIAEGQRGQLGGPAGRRGLADGNRQRIAGPRGGRGGFN